jgi:aspartyl-tRNA synthetase
MHPFRTHTCADLRQAHAGETVRLSGWVHAKRDHGGLLFIDLRDHFGLTQCVIDMEGALFPAVEGVRVESVVTVTGTVIERTAETVNPDLPTGTVEVRIEDFAVESPADVLPMQVNSTSDYGEDIRLRYRFLDLRRDKLHRNILLRANVISSIRRRMTDQGFIEFQTPILTASRPKARATTWCRVAQPSGQVLRAAAGAAAVQAAFDGVGLRRYFQIAPCFRDEDARADRSPGEFYQLDFEMAFVTQDDVFAAIEPVLPACSRNSPTAAPSRRAVPAHPLCGGDAEVRHRQAGPAQPHRNGRRRGETFRGSGFKVFAGMIEKNPAVTVRAIPAKGGGSRAFCDRMNAWAQGEGQPGLGYIFFRDGGGPVPSPRTSASRARRRCASLGLGDGDAVFFVAGVPGRTRSRQAHAMKMATDLELCEQNAFRFCWIVDFPMYEMDEDTEQIDFSHNPFSMPQGGLEALETMDPLDILAYQYDIVCNGVELSSGAIRNHRPTSCSRRSPSPATARRWSRTNSAACCAPSATARRRTAGRRRASTASSCCWPTNPTSARSSPSR